MTSAALTCEGTLVCTSLDQVVRPGAARNAFPALVSQSPFLPRWKLAIRTPPGWLREQEAQRLCAFLLEDGAGDDRGPIQLLQLPRAQAGLPSQLSVGTWREPASVLSFLLSSCHTASSCHHRDI